MSSHFDRCVASALVPTAPAGLPALRFWGREDARDGVRLVAVGDLGLSGRVKDTLTPGMGLPGVGPAALTGADLVMANLEGLLGGVGGVDVGGRPFVAPDWAAETLRQSGIGLVHLANNHALDLGQSGLARTILALQAVGVRVIGAGLSPEEAAQPVRLASRGVSIAIVGAGRTEARVPRSGPTINPLDGPGLVRAVESVRASADVVIVSLHTGFMYVEYPHPATRGLARSLTEAGADLVVMHHPHVLQGAEVHQGGRAVCYSLGNFLFDWQEGHLDSGADEVMQREGGLFVFRLGKTGIQSAAFVPTLMDENCQVGWPRPQEAEEILSRIETLSHDLSGDYEPAFWRQRAERNTAPVIRALLMLLRAGRMRDAAGFLLRVRPHHFGMVARWVAGRLGFTA